MGSVSRKQKWKPLICFEIMSDQEFVCLLGFYLFLNKARVDRKWCWKVRKCTGLSFLILFRPADKKWRWICYITFRGKREFTSDLKHQRKVIPLTTLEVSCIGWIRISSPENGNKSLWHCHSLTFCDPVTSLALLKNMKIFNLVINSMTEMYKLFFRVDQQKYIFLI